MRKLSFFILLLSILLQSTYSQGQKIGALNFSPMMNCNIGKTMLLSDVMTQRAKYQNTEQEADFSGYELDILIRAAILNNSNFSTIQLTCFSTQEEVLAALDAGSIHYGIGGMQIDYSKLEKGFYFSLPLYSGGLKIAIKVDDHKTIWSFFDPFHWSLWVVLFFTTLFVSIITWLFEDSYFQNSCCKRKSDTNSSQKGISNQQRQQQLIMNSEEFSKEDSHNSSRQIKQNYKMQVYQNFLEMIWQSFSSLFFASSIRLQKFSARIIFLGFWFVVIIVSATYVSNLTTMLALRRRVSSISSYSDIINSENVRIYTFQNYVGTYINPSDFKGKQEDIFITFPHTKDGQSQLINQFYVNSNSEETLNHVLMVDFPIVHNVVSKYPCTTSVLHETLNDFNYGVIVKDATVLKTLNSLLYTFIDDPYWLNLIQTYLNETPQEHSCFIKQGYINLYSIAGLWVFIGISIAVAIMIDRAEACRKKMSQKKKQKEAQDPYKSQKLMQVKTMKQHQKQDKELEIQQNVSPSLKGDELQSANKKVDGSSQIHNTSVANGKNITINNVNDVINRIPNNSARYERSISIKKDQNGLVSQSDIQTQEDTSEVWSDFLMVSDYIHIPSKDIHLQAQDEIKMQINIVESVIKKRFNNVEENIIRIMKKCPIKVGTKTMQEIEDRPEGKRYKGSFSKE